MTATPHTIGRTQSLAMASDLMRAHGIRHLPVLDGGRLVGLLSQRDVYLVETLPGANAAEVRAEEAMVPDVLTTNPDAALADVVEEMVERKAGSAVVMENQLVIGVLTTIDAMKALLDRLAAAGDDDL
jgi:acetoin utilization protein AcuB